MTERDASFFIKTWEMLENRWGRGSEEAEPWEFYYSILSKAAVPLTGWFYKQEKDGAWSFVACLKGEPSSYRRELSKAEFKVQKSYPGLSFTVQVINPEQVGTSGISSLQTKGFVRYERGT